MEENKVIAFKNVHDYPISIGVKFGGRSVKCTLWRDERFKFKDKAGKYHDAVPDREEWPRLMRLGIKPIYSSEVPEEKKISRAPEMVNTEVILDDAALMAAHKKAAAAPPQSEAFIEEVIDEAVIPPKVTERGDNPNPTKADLVWQDADGVWIFNKDAKQNLNPAKIKAHIKKTYGDDYLETVEWQQFGVKSLVADK